jgi:hypothetical protein
VSCRGLLSVRVGDLTDQFGPADVHGCVDLAGLRSGISRKDFGLTWNAVLETGGVLVGDEITIDLHVQFVKSQA